MNTNLSPLSSRLSPALTRWQTRSLIVAIIATLVSFIGAFVDPGQFYHSYLFAWLFWCGVSIGALIVAMLQFLTGGEWGNAVRGLSIAAFRVLPCMALLFIPVLVGLRDIYRWSMGFNVEMAEYRHKAHYLSPPFFTVRSVFYFAVLITFAILLRKKWQQSNSQGVTALSAGGLISYVVCMNFASTDWVMSLNPKWYSTIFTEIFGTGQFLAALALLIVLLATFGQSTLLGEMRAKVFHDLGNVLLAFVIFWAYLAFSQFLIIWSGNLPNEISWYLDRSRGGWQWLALAVLIFQLLLPLILLLSREAKRNPRRLVPICICILAGNVLVNFWLVAPSFHPAGFFLHWLDFAELVALGSLWFTIFFHFAKQEPLWPEQVV